MLVIDPYWLKQTHGVQKTDDEIPADCTAQSSQRSFRVRHFNMYKLSQKLRTSV